MSKIIELKVDKKLIEGDLNHTYSPLQNIQKSDGTIGDFTVHKELGLSLNNPLHIECQPSYDGTVNLIINDDKNPPRIINSRFSKIEDNKYKIINRNQTQQSNIYEEGSVDLQTRLFRNSNSFPILDFMGVNYSGKLKGGNYTFYIKFADSDENETDIVCESGIVSIFNGTISDVTSITGTLLNEETNKAARFKLSNIDTTFPKFYIYYSRETSDLNGTRIFEVGKLSKAYDVVDSSQEVVISGYEDVVLLTENDLNIRYLTVSAAKTQAQVQNMLFFANVQEDEVKNKILQNISYYIDVSIQQKKNSIGWVDSIRYKTSESGSEYYDPKNIYYNLGYWPEELYRIGIVYIMNDDSLTNVFNLRGCTFEHIGDNNLTKTDVYSKEEYLPSDSFLNGGKLHSNTYGVFKNPIESSDNVIQNYTDKSVKPWYYQMNFSDELLNELKALGVKGYFFVRQKRLPLTLCQGVSVGIDMSANIPALYDNSRKEYLSQAFINSEGILNPTIVTIDKSRISGSALFSAEATFIPELQAQLNGAYFTLQKVRTNGTVNSASNVYYNFNFGDYKETSTYSLPCVFVKEDTPYKYMNGYGFSSRVGSELAVKEFGFFGALPEEKLKESNETPDENNGYLLPSWDTDLYSKLVRGIYTSYIGVCGQIDASCLYNIKIQNYSEYNIRDYITIRGNDNSPFYAISNRKSIKESSEDVYRGDCFTCTITERVNRNFRDPDLPINDTIINNKTWAENYAGWTNTPSVSDIENEKGYSWANINRGDVNAVPLGTWVSYKCLSNYNLGLRSEDTSDLSEMALLGVEKSFYPRRGMETKSAFKMSDSSLLNKGLSSTTSRKWNSIVQNVPYIKNNFDNRIMFSNVFTEENFRNGYRIFQGLSYKDIDRQYGAIVKLLPWGTNLFCVFEHGLGIIPINEKALIQTATDQSVHMYGAGVIQNQISLISPDFGSIWPESIVRTPLGIYGVDSSAKKIWRFSDSKGLEMISDMKIQRFLNEHLKLSELDKYPTVSLKNIKSHYNNYKGDVMFTFYNDSKDETWNFCFNERLNKWVTRYSWTPLYSANIDNIFYSLDQNRAKILAHIYNNRNCTYGLRSKNNTWDATKSINEFEIWFEGSMILPEISIESIDCKYIKNGKEFALNTPYSESLADYLYLEHNQEKLKIVGNHNGVNNWFLANYKINIPPQLEINIKCKFDDRTLIEVLGIVLEDPSRKEEIETFTRNGFYVHGRAGIFNELDYNDASFENQILPTKWYDKQEPFEFEFVVNGDSVGLHKIFNNLVIISNNVQPEQFEFSIIGDVYDFNKTGIFRSKTFGENEWDFAKSRKDDSNNDYWISQEFENCDIKWDNNQNNYWISLKQDTKNIKEFGRLLGNIHYKEDAWYVTIDPIKYKNKFKLDDIVTLSSEVSDVKVRDKFIKIKVRYSGEDLVIITALQTLLNISYS